ncbi:hypothetical protein BDDG_00837 [Blastomyces dermatitidis ATCC 18188]|uniref:Myb-like domain-containing protein n=1 Tax=Ajellomyces dermatitidis (strain ATCC 18188 / CBS 674.68) TaxID=653446 RepID=F2T398_AJEDA|nr:hypothetical protein BDDG_00837 [Blastomyces dermatitidis ATCC 18188]
MSSTASAYDPDEEEDSSDNNSFGRGVFPTGFATSSPPLQKLRLESSTELSSPSRPSRPQSSGSATVHSKSWRNGSRTDRRLPSDSYVELFNDFVHSAVDRGVDASGSGFATSQLGIITWSSKEKEMLFNALERKGKDRIPEIASLLGSKSEMEIRDYLAALHRGLESQQLKTRYGKPLILSDVPAASEISEECCQALEDNALALSRQDEQTKNTMGRRKYGDMWLVDRHVAAMVENELDAERGRSDDGGNEAPDNSHPPPSIIATSQLLNAGNWVLLSERIFMNAGQNRIEDNWYHLSVDGETPSLTCEAFSDFYALAVSLTRRLVHSSIFFAMSRLRSLQRGGYERAKLIRREDVGAAVDILRMSHNSRQFWIGAPRRHNLDVADIRHRKGCKPLPLTYNEVEEELSLEGTRSRTSRASSVALSVAVSENQSEAEESPGKDSVSGVSDPSTPSKTTSDDDEDESHLDPEEIHAASMDQKSSRIEELRLWKLLNQSPPRSLLPEHEDSDIEMGGDDKIAVVRLSGTQKSKQDLIDWRDRVLYRSEWEEFGPDTIFVEEELSENRRKKRRLE